MDPTQLYLDQRRRAILPDGTLDPVFWKFLSDLQVSLTTIDLTSQVSGILPTANGGTGDAAGTIPGTSLTGTVLASSIVTSSLTALGILAALSCNGVINGMSDIYTTAWTDYSGTSTVTGWASFTSKVIRYKIIGKLNLVAYDLGGTSNAVGISFTLPTTSANTSVGFETAVGVTIDNGTTQTTPGRAELPANSATVTCFKDSASAAWTNTGTKRVIGQFWYEGA